MVTSAVSDGTEFQCPFPPIPSLPHVSVRTGCCFFPAHRIDFFMPHQILFEGDSLTRSQGTGITTYARNLNEAVRSSGYATDVLVNVRAPLDRRDPTLNEVTFFDAIPSKPTLSQGLRDARSYVLGSPSGIKAVELKRDGVVVDSVPSAITGFDRLY